jgi:hypothetical protein
MMWLNPGYLKSTEMSWWKTQIYAGHLRQFKYFMIVVLLAAAVVASITGDSERYTSNDVDHDHRTR